jgi:IMP and pyridine-specific 5'-nucleotidase
MVAIVTAAGYHRDSKRYEARLSGLLNGFKESNVDNQNLERFYVFGGECNVNTFSKTVFV